MTGIAASQAERAHGSIVARLAVGLVVLSLLLSALVALVVWSAATALGEMRRAEQSFRQLETARNLEAAFGGFLVAEVGRRLAGGAPDQTPEAGALRAALLDYRTMIGDEIATSGTATERDDERAELVRSNALAELFDAIETEALLERGMGADPAVRTRIFLNQIAGDRDRAFRSILYEIGQDERAEIDAAGTALRDLRNRALISGGALGFAFLAAAFYFGTSFRSGLMRPIQGLTRAAEAFGKGDRRARVPTGLPGEFRTLGARFNEMAADLAARQTALEDQVALRTAELASVNEELRKVDLTRRRFFANVSHELRTPVTVLLGEAQIGQRSDDPEMLRDSLARIQASGTFLRRRLDDLMRLARSEDGALELNMTETAFPDPIREAVDLARGYAAASEVEIFIEMDGSESLRADPEALRQAALALIDNAVKFSPPGGAVTVRATLSDRAAKFSVTDQGPGFSGDADALLDRYAQEGTGRAAGGSGLGLAIARWIAEQHGGSVTAANRAEGGATVTLDIPRRPGQENAN